MGGPRGSLGQLAWVVRPPYEFGPFGLQHFLSASEQTGDSFNDFDNFDLKAKARIWP